MRRIEYRWVILATGFTVLFFSSGSRFAFGLLLKPMSEDLELSRSALSLAATCFMIVSAVSMPFVGRLVDSFSVRTVVAIAAVIASVGIGLMGLAQTQWQVILLYGIIFAIGNGGSSVGPIGVMISRWFERGRAPPPAPPCPATPSASLSSSPPSHPPWYTSAGATPT